MAYKVLVDDNFHYQDKSERYKQGEYDSYETAVAACKYIVDQYLAAAYKEGMTPAELYNSYLSFGEDPFVVPEPEGANFSAWSYAKKRCQDFRDTKLL
jgi:hypothetical protein